MDQSTYLTNFSNTLFEFSKANILCDTTLVAKNREFTAHSAVLAAASTTLRTAFENSFGKKSMYRIELLETDGTTVESVLFLIYTGNVKALEVADLSEDKSAELITTCEHLGLDWIWSQLDPSQRLTALDESTLESLHEIHDSESPSGIDLALNMESVAQTCHDGNSESSHDYKNFNTFLIKEEISRTVAEQLLDGEIEQVENFACDICSKIFGSESLLKTHRARHLSKPLICEHCGCQFKYPGAMRRHAEIHKENPNQFETVCHICGTVVGPLALESHLAKAHGGAGDSLHCDLCDFQVTDESHLERHQREAHADERPFVCSQCQKSFREKGQLKKHLLIHDSGKNYVCEVCSRSFSLEYYLKKHQRTHNNTLDYACPTCGKQFKLLEYLKVHMKSHCGGEGDVEDAKTQKVHRCSVCGQTFSHHSYLKKHARMHNGEKPYECEVCGKRFKVNCIQQHMLTHSGERPHGCDKCGRRFTRLADLQAHLQTHSGTKSHWCPVCMRGFHKKGDLQRHIRIHTGERPYVCETCGKSFKILFHLRLHSYVHSTDRPHKCGTCGKAFSSNVRLKKHEFIHSGLRPFACPICHRRFNRQANMRSHMKTHGHGITKMDCEPTDNDLQVVLSARGDLVENHEPSDNLEIIYCKVEQPDILVALPVESLQDYKL